MSDDNRALLDDFVVESREQLARAESGLMELEASEDLFDVELVNQIFRAVHSVKGSADFLGLTTVGELSHALESVLDLLRSSVISPEVELINLLLRCNDRLSVLVDDVHQSNDADIKEELQDIKAWLSSEASVLFGREDADSKPEAPVERVEALVEPGAQGSIDTVRVKTTVLDSLMAMAGEMVLARNRLMTTLAGHSDQIENLPAILSRVGGITTEVHQQIMRARLQPLGSLFDRFRRVVRDLSARLDKRAQLLTSGGEVELDRAILEGLSDTLIHLLRNCIDHGIEARLGRAARGKPLVGTIRIDAYSQAGMVNIDLSDDGAGMDTDHLIGAALKKGMITEEQQGRITRKEAVEFVFLPGFSTATEVSDLSGRGVGMDVVFNNIQRLGGTVTVVSELGHGTTCQLKLPLTLAIISALTVETEGRRFVVPQFNVEEAIRLAPGDRSRVIGRLQDVDVLPHRGELVPVVHLSILLELGRTYQTSEGQMLSDRRFELAERRHNLESEPETQSADERRESSQRRQSQASVRRMLLLKVGGNRFALMVDKIIDNEEIVVKPLSKYLRSCECYSGSTILGDGQVALILDPEGIVARAGIRFEKVAAGQLPRDAAKTPKVESEAIPFVLFSWDEREVYALPSVYLKRIEKIQAGDITLVSGRPHLGYHDQMIPLVSLETVLGPSGMAPEAARFVIVASVGDRDVGIVAGHVYDIEEGSVSFFEGPAEGPGLLGTMSFAEGRRSATVLDFFYIVTAMDSRVELPCLEGPAKRILLIEPQPFWGRTISHLLSKSGFGVEWLDAFEGIVSHLPGSEYDVLVIDLQVGGIRAREFVEWMRETESIRDLPIIALSDESLGDVSDYEMGLFDAFVPKTDAYQLLTTLLSIWPAGDFETSVP